MDPLTILSLITTAASILGKVDGAPPEDAITALLKKLNDTGIVKLPKELSEGQFDEAVQKLVGSLKDWLPFLRDKAGLPAGGLDSALVAAIQKLCLGSPTGTTTGGVATRARFDAATHAEVNLSPEMKAEIGDPGKWLRVFLTPNAIIDRDLLTRAFVAWQDVIGMRVRIVHDENAANVIINVVPLDGLGGKLAEATVGDGPGSPLVSTLSIDQSEAWTPEKYLYALEHEIGHLLGLGGVGVIRAGFGAGEWIPADAGVLPDADLLPDGEAAAGGGGDTPKESGL